MYAGYHKRDCFDLQIDGECVPDSLNFGHFPIYGTTLAKTSQEFQRTFHDFCTIRNIDHYFIHKNSPNENAVIERSFRTDQDEFYNWLERKPEHIGELNKWLTTFMGRYNNIRPHQSLDYQTPAEVVKLYILQAVV